MNLKGYKEMMSATDATMDDFINKLKSIPAYEVYEHAVKEKGNKDTFRLLQIVGMLFSMADSEFHMMLTSISLELLFSMADQKLRGEILESEV